MQNTIAIYGFHLPSFERAVSQYEESTQEKIGYEKQYAASNMIRITFDASVSLRQAFRLGNLYGAAILELEHL